MARSKALTGILLAAGGSLVFSLNDLAIKLLSDGYALHQIILIRAFIGIALVLVLMAFSREGFRQILTRRPGAHLVRVVHGADFALAGSAGLQSTRRGPQTPACQNCRSGRRQTRAA